jgi:hypothetical protein
LKASLKKQQASLLDRRKDMSEQAKMIGGASEVQELSESDLETVNGGLGITFGREKLKGTSKTQGDFNLTSNPVPQTPTGLTID